MAHGLCHNAELHFEICTTGSGILKVLVRIADSNPPNAFDAIPVTSVSSQCKQRIVYLGCIDGLHQISVNEFDHRTFLIAASAATRKA